MPGLPSSRAPARASARVASKTARQRPSSSRWRDAGVAAALCVVAVLVGSSYVSAVIRSGGKARFYQGQFGAAVMMACGRGYVDPDDSTLPALRAFLQIERDRLSCSDLPEKLATLPLTPMQRAFRYLMSTVAWTWRVFGLSWSGLAPLYGVFFGATILASYGVFRTGMGTVLAALASGALTISTSHLVYLPHLRDYSKAPFVLALIVLLAWLVTGPVARIRVIAIAALYGLVLGVGVGFRNDLLIALPPFVLAVAVFLPARVREHAGLKLAAIVTCCATLYLAMYPMRSIYAPGGGNSMQHVVVLGLITPFSEALGVDNGGIYGWGYEFKDEYAHATISSYATRTDGVARSLELYGPAYDRAASSYLASVATNFPADMLVRVYASVLKVLALPYNDTSLQAPTWLDNRLIVRAYHARGQALRELGAAWPWIILAALVGLSLADVRLSIFVIVITFYFAAYPVLQFHERHFFHLEFMAWWALGFVVQQTLERLATLRHAATWGRNLSPRRWLEWWPNIRGAALVWIALAVVLAAPLWLLRQYQQRHVSAILTRYLALDRVPLDREAVPAGTGLVRIEGPARSEMLEPGGPSDSVRSEYLVAEFAAGACEVFKLDVTFRYRSAGDIVDFSRTMQVRPPLAAGAVQRVFFPAYFHRGEEGGIGHYGLAGIEMPEVASACLSGLYRVRDVRGLGLLLDLNLPPGWEQATLFQTIDGLESRNNGTVSPDIYTWPPTLPVSRAMLNRPVRPITEQDIVQRSTTLQVRDGHWRVNGVGGVGGRGPFLYLAQMKAQPGQQGSVVLAQGHLDRGGVSLGLVRDGAWVAQVPVTAPGEFLILIRVPADGTYSVVLANNVPGRSLDNQVSIRRIGWLSAT